jgi:hypothetical protein
MFEFISLKLSTSKNASNYVNETLSPMFIRSIPASCKVQAATLNSFYNFWCRPHEQSLI